MDKVKALNNITMKTVNEGGFMERYACTNKLPKDRQKWTMYFIFLHSAMIALRPLSEDKPF